MIFISSSRAALHHPDKATSDESRHASETYFVHLKLAQDTLLNPTKRFAYDRFGPDITQWRHCSSIRDYILVGVQSIAPYYVAGALFMIILGVLGYLEWGRYVCYIPPYPNAALMLISSPITVALPLLHLPPHLRTAHHHSPLFPPHNPQSPHPRLKNTNQPPTPPALPTADPRSENRSHALHRLFAARSTPATIESRI